MRVQQRWWDLDPSECSDPGQRINCSVSGRYDGDHRLTDDQRVAWLKQLAQNARTMHEEHGCFARELGASQHTHGFQPTPPSKQAESIEDTPVYHSPWYAVVDKIVDFVHVRRHDLRTLEHVLQHAETGDIVVMRAHDVSSMAQRVGGNLSWTHSGVLMRNPEDELLYIMESTAGYVNTPDIVQMRPHSGIGMNAASDVLEQYTMSFGEVAWCPLRSLGDDDDAATKMRRRLLHAIAETYHLLQHLPYVPSPVVLISVIMPGLSRAIAALLPSVVAKMVFGDVRGSYCSQAVCTVLMLAGLMDADANPFLFPPDAFTDARTHPHLSGAMICAPFSVIPAHYHTPEYWAAMRRSFSSIYDFNYSGFIGFVAKLGMHH